MPSTENLWRVFILQKRKVSHENSAIMLGNYINNKTNQNLIKGYTFLLSKLLERKKERKILMSFLSSEKVILLKQVIRYAEEYYDIYRKYTPETLTLKESINFQSSDEGKKVEEFRAKLERYLMDQDFEDVKFIQTVMYTGRDEERGDTELPPSQLYNEVNRNLTWSTKKIEVGQMVGKLPLAKYLKRGLELLNR